jgi:hypothetical protein
MLIREIRTESARSYLPALLDAAKLLSYERSRVEDGSTSEIRTSDTFFIPKGSTLDSICFKVFAEAMETYLKGLKPYQIPRITRDEGYQLLRYKKRQKYGMHFDEIGRLHRIISAVFYINSDYCGGELFFPIQKKRIKPKAGSVVLFPSNYAFPHSSLPIKSGTKYSIVTWFF